MPILDVTLLAGRPYEKKKKLIEELTAATVRSLDVAPEQVRVILREVPAAHFAVAGKPRGEPGQ